MQLRNQSFSIGKVVKHDFPYNTFQWKFSSQPCDTNSGADYLLFLVEVYLTARSEKKIVSNSDMQWQPHKAG